MSINQTFILLIYRKMKVKELIKKLEEYDGNLDVVVQYRDEGWDYGWYDDELRFSTTTVINKKFLKEWQKVYREFTSVYWNQMVVVDVDRLYL